MERLKDQVAIVTGGSKGIGRAIAATLASEGCAVVIAARGKGDLDRAVSDLKRPGLDILGIPADIASEQDVKKLVAETITRFGRIDILVNNAGIGVFKPVAELSASDLDSMWNTNLRGAFLATKEVLPHMTRAKGGEIVFIASLAGKNSIKGGAGYAATKWAMRGFASSLMLEVREHNIRVMTIFPGSVDTSFSSMNKKGSHITQPEDVASAVLFAVTAPGRSMFSEIDVRPTNPAR
jgi:3-oxoacyl-[acyl-carrier protein] reductase